VAEPQRRKDPSLPSRERAETIKWLREWADALQKFSAEARAQADGEVVWWMRKAADLLEADGPRIEELQRDNEHAYTAYRELTEGRP
jgi:hypothetical protein